MVVEQQQQQVEWQQQLQQKQRVLTLCQFPLLALQQLVVQQDQGYSKSPLHPWSSIKLDVATTKLHHKIGTLL